MDIFDKITGTAQIPQTGDVFDRVAKSKSVAEEARERLAARGVNPDVPVDMQGAPRKSAFRRFQDSASEIREQGPNPFEYTLAAAKGVLPIPTSWKEVGDLAIGLPATVAPILPRDPRKSLLPSFVTDTRGEVRGIGDRYDRAQTEFADSPWRRRLMTAAGVLPVVGEGLSNVIRPTAVASDRIPTDEERLAAVQGTFQLGDLASFGAKSAVPKALRGGEWSNIDPTKGARAHLADKTASQLWQNMLQPKDSQLDFGAEPGKFAVGTSTKLGGGVTSASPQFEAKLKALNAQADQVAFNTLEGRFVPIDYEGALRTSFAQHIDDALMSGDEATAKRLGVVLENEIRKLHGITGGEGSAPARLGRSYHQGLGDRVRSFKKKNKAGVADPAEGTIRSAREDAWVAIKQKTNEAVPGLKDLNEEIHSGIEATKTLEVRGKAESKSDPFSFIKHPIATVTNATFGSPWLRSRVASGLASLGGKPTGTFEAVPLKGQPGATELVFTPPPGATPPLRDVGLLSLFTKAGDPVVPPSGVPGSVGGENVRWRAGVRRPANEQRALPPAPMSAPEGFRSSSDLRRVGTRLGQMPSQDAVVFAPQGQTSGMVPPEVSPVPQAPTEPPLWLNELNNRRTSNLYNLAAEGDFRDLSRTLSAQRAEDFLSGAPAGRINPSRTPDWLGNQQNVPPVDEVARQNYLRQIMSTENPPVSSAPQTEFWRDLQERLGSRPVLSDVELAALVQEVATSHGMTVPSDRPLIYYRAIPGGEGNVNAIEHADGTVRPYSYALPGQFGMRSRGIPLHYGGSKNPVLSRIIDVSGSWDDTGALTGQSPGAWNEAVNPDPVSVRRLHEGNYKLPELFAQVGSNELTIDDGANYLQRTYVVDPARTQSLRNGRLGALESDAYFLRDVSQFANDLLPPSASSRSTWIPEINRRIGYFRRVMEVDPVRVTDPVVSAKLRSTQMEIGALMERLKGVARGEIQDINWSQSDAAQAVSAYEGGDGFQSP